MSSRAKRILKALGLEDEYNALFAVRPRAPTPTPRTAPPQNPLAVKLERAATQAQRALPAPPKRLALPAPGPRLPPAASKPRGGQFWTDQYDAGISPEGVARRQAAEASQNFADFGPVFDDVPLDDPTLQHNLVRDWLAKSLAKYYKTDFGAPDDPLRDLAARGLHYDPDMTPEQWKATVDSYLMEDPIGQVLFPSNPLGGMPGAGDNMRGEAMAAMPWLAKQPVTDNVYGIAQGGLDIGHFSDELRNALNPDTSGLPPDLALRPESLARMSFPQAVERVGRINQFRVKQMDEAAQALANNPAVQTFKDYPDAGYRWVELRQPELTDDLFDDVDRGLVDLAVKEGREIDPARMDEARASRARTSLQDALKYEGDTMGHCVGGYCDDVLSGRSRIFSLRDAKGQPHVTIETSPGNQSDAYRQAIAELRDTPLWGDWLEHQRTADQRRAGGSLIDYMNTFRESKGLPRLDVDVPQNIIQIKGKQNRAPVDDYLPYVQDFVKGGTWGNVGDLGNTGLVKLPDGRYITKQQYAEGRAKIFGPDNEWALNNTRLYDDRWLADRWDELSPNFEGFAIGGRVDADRCFSRSPFGVRR